MAEYTRCKTVRFLPATWAMIKAEAHERGITTSAYIRGLTEKAVERAKTDRVIKREGRRIFGIEGGEA